MLKIQVLGKGLIPRGYGLAPRKEFFNADLNFIGTILMTPGLKVNMLNPEDGKIIQVTNSNIKRLWNKYRSDVYNGNTISNVVEKDVNDEEESKSDFMNPPTTKEETEVIKPVTTDNIYKKEESVENDNNVIKPVTEADKTSEEKYVKNENDNKNDSIKPVMNPNENKNNNNNHNKKK